jgi:hypothetical protein
MDLKIPEELRMVQAIEGPNDIHRWVIARSLLRGHRKVVE